MSYALTRREAVAQETMSDDALRDERNAQTKFYTALASFRSACQDAMALTSIMDGQIKAMLNAVDDETPSREVWNGQINEERSAA
jgi:hypothetical protein